MVPDLGSLSSIEHQQTLRLGLRILSYLPLSLFAANLSVQSAVLSAICSESTITHSATGNVKDLSKLWNLNYIQLFGNFEMGKSYSVSSMRNGNIFALANQGFLELIGLIGSPSRIPVHTHFARPTTVTVSLLESRRNHASARNSLAYWLSHSFNVLQLFVHFAGAITFGLYNLYVSAILCTCLFLLGFLQAILRFSVSVNFSKPRGSDGKPIPVSSGPPLDVHIVASSWNASDIDVIIGNTVLLHALTNIPIRVSRPELVIWIMRALAVVIIVQAATLASLVGDDTPQVFGSIVWLVCHLVLLGSARMQQKLVPDLLLQDQPSNFSKLKPFVFSNRRIALACISTLPATQREGVNWSWMDGSIPDNARRHSWLNELCKSSLRAREGDPEDVSEEMEATVKEVRAYIDQTEYQMRLNRLSSKSSSA